MKTLTLHRRYPRLTRPRFYGAGLVAIATLVLTLGHAFAQQGSPRRFSCKPYLSGPDDPEYRAVRGTIKMGETVIIECPGGADAELGPGVVPEPSQTKRRYSRFGGPFLLEDVKVGDWVAIKIIDVKPGPYGYTNNWGPLRGPWRTIAPVKDGMLLFEPDFAIPVRPMVGTIYLKSAAATPGGAGAWDHGGNFDSNSIRAGSTVYIRAQFDGGYLTVTDTHAYQGDGEMTGTGIEIDADVTLQVTKSPHHFPTGGVVVETADKWYTNGVGKTWEDAVKIAWSEMVYLLCYLHDTTPEYANRMVGALGDALPGYTAGNGNMRGFDRPRTYVTMQIGIPKELKHTGKKWRVGQEP